jgi:hypothetical protein
MMTPQQQLTAFLQHCTNIRAGKTFSFKKKSSSLKYFIAALEAEIQNNRVKGLLEEGYTGIVAELKQRSPKDHVKYLAAIKSICAVWGSTKDYVALNLSLPQAITTLYWNPVTGALSDIPSKISVSSRFPGYHTAVANHLVALSRITTGNILLTALDQSNFSTAIVDHPLSNQCGTNGSTGGMNKLAKELYETLTMKFGVETKAAVNRAVVGGKTRAKWLADKINATPKYQLKGAPATTPRNLGVTEANVNSWMGAGSIWDEFGNDPDLEQIKNAIIIALYSVSDAGVGANSTVNYSLGSTNPLNDERPPAIGLAHELVHAYYNGLGIQPGFEVENPTTVLFEYRCVGLGPWAAGPVSENAIRNEWAGTILHFDDDDVRNRKLVDLRAFYSPA